MKAGILKEHIEIYEPVTVTTDFGNTHMYAHTHTQTHIHISAHLHTYICTCTRIQHNNIRTQHTAQKTDTEQNKVQQ